MGQLRVYPRKRKQIDQFPAYRGLGTISPIQEIIENFLYQLGRYHQLVQSLSDKSKVQAYVFNIEKSKKLLIALSGVVQV